ncbi:MAG: SpoIID/LytB domain-containing protein, partial [Acidimicrobiales bacterium]
VAVSAGVPPAAGALAAPPRAQVPALLPAARPHALPPESTDVRIAMTENDTRTVIVASPGGVSAPGVADAPGVLFRPSGGSWTVFTSGGGCGGPWTPAGTVASSVTASPVTAGSLLTLCVAGTQSTTLQGTVSGVYNSNGQARTVDTVPLEQYVADVVPAESPSSWATLGGAGPQDHTWGFQELEAQAVAVRSYVLSNPGGYGGYADTCDLTCQTYRGTYYRTADSVAAALDTEGQVMVLPTGKVATTEYSSSTGGYTSSSAETSPFNPVPDTGDAVAGNTHHDWSASVTLSVIAKIWPKEGANPTVANPTNRNGLGTWGGRVISVTITGTGNSQAVPVATFLARLDAVLGGTSLQSNWFDITPARQTPSQVVFTGHGWGHGIGMGQWGALGYAVGQDGGNGNWGYHEIVDHYYGPSVLGDLPGSPTYGKPSGGVGGYWEVASDGGIFSFGNAGFHGSMGGKPLNQPIVGMAATPTGGGYWEVASDGGIFSFGTAGFAGSAAGTAAGPGTVALLATRTGQGYLDLTGTGRLTSYGDAPHLGDMSTAVPGYAGRVLGGATTPG